MKEKECPVCHYSGLCPKCGGRKGGATYVCSTCNGTGECPQCNGKGTVEEKEINL